jgi:hypothetical protein
VVRGAIGYRLLRTHLAGGLTSHQSSRRGSRPHRRSIAASGRYRLHTSWNSRCGCVGHCGIESKQPFLWIDDTAGRAERLRDGEILAAPLSPHGTERAADGLIHHWIGAVFIPRATLGELVSVVHDYDKYKDFYKPLVVVSRAISLSEQTQEFYMVWQKRVLLLNVAIEGRYRSRDVSLGAGRGYTISDSTRLQQIEDYGAPGERRLLEGAGSGFIWRVHSIARYEERDGGVYLEIEAFALTRDIPASLRWLVVPIVTRVSVDSISTCLRETRNAIEAATVSLEGRSRFPDAPCFRAQQITQIAASDAANPFHALPVRLGIERMYEH